MLKFYYEFKVMEKQDFYILLSSLFFLLGSTADLLLVFSECWGLEDAQRTSSVPNPGLASLPALGSFTVLLSSFSALLFLVHVRCLSFCSCLPAWHLHWISQHCCFGQEFLAALGCVADVAGSTGKLDSMDRKMFTVVGSANGSYWYFGRKTGRTFYRG